jgi:hypothetical protein
MTEAGRLEYFIGSLGATQTAFLMPLLFDFCPLTSLQIRLCPLKSGFGDSEVAIPDLRFRALLDILVLV